MELINQCLESLTEYCQGPCPENQVLNRFPICALARVYECLPSRMLTSQCADSLLVNGLLQKEN